LSWTSWLEDIRGIDDVLGKNYFIVLTLADIILLPHLPRFDDNPVIR
jgi:hypothetical protein